MPERSAYDEAILLSEARLKVSDPELTQGKVEKFTVQTAAGPMERPWGLEGGFAVVYKFRTHSGAIRALRCFRVPMSSDTQFRYERISSYFATHMPTFTASFKYHDDGIVVKENVAGQTKPRPYPLIEMDWIEGATLLERIDELCTKQDHAELEALANQWLDLLQTMRQAGIAHGDLAAVNIMVRPDGGLVLVDYDGVYIPDFASLKPVVVGQPDYQHPQIQQRQFNEQTDNFSALVIYIALLALQAQPALWSKYTLRSPQGKLLNVNLLFTQQDFLLPDRSPLLQNLMAINNSRLNAFLQVLKESCLQPVEQMQFPWHLLDFDKKAAFSRLEHAIQVDNDEEIVEAWDPILASYKPAQQYIKRIEYAKERLKALEDLRTALQTHAIQQIVNSYNALLDGYASIEQDEHEQLLLARNFVEAMQDDDDQALVSTWEEIQNFAHKDFFQLTPQEQQRLALAQERQTALVKYRVALMHKRVRPIVTAYQPILDECKNVSAKERNLLKLAQAFVAVYDNDDDDDLCNMSQSIQKTAQRDIIFTQQEQQRVVQAQQRRDALTKFRTALMSKRIQLIVAAYAVVLEKSSAFTQTERDLFKLAQNLLLAYNRNDDAAIATAWSDIRNSGYQKRFVFTAQEQQRITQAQQRVTALTKFRNALTSKNTQQIVNDYDALLDGYAGIEQDEREAVLLACNFVQAIQDDDDQVLIATWEEIQNFSYKGFFHLTPQEQQRLTLAQERRAALVKFRVALMGKQVQPIVTAYQSILDECKNVTQEERELLALARNFVAALQSDDDQKILSASQEIQRSRPQKRIAFLQQEQQRIARAQMRLAQGGRSHA